jgi:hypothetical protein
VLETLIIKKIQREFEPECEEKARIREVHTHTTRSHWPSHPHYTLTLAFTLPPELTLAFTLTLAFAGMGVMFFVQKWHSMPIFDSIK